MKNQYQSLIKHFSGRKPLINIVLDGYGIGKPDHTNAIHQAETPFMSYLLSHYPNTRLATHGHHVGLPGEKDLGGSEVGHLTMGAGRIIDQGPTLITNAIQDGSFYELPVLKEALDHCQGGALHLLGLLSDGNVHSHLSHFVAVIEEAVRRGIKRCFVHALLDGRDVGIQSAHRYIGALEKLFTEIMADHPDFEYGFASGGGREVVTMDRDQNWTKVQRGWKTHVLGGSGEVFDSATQAIHHFRKKWPTLIDQDCPPFNVKGKDGEIPKMKDGDTVIFMNFRGDRAIEITRAFCEEGFSKFEVNPRPKVFFCGLMVYDEDTNMPPNRIVQSPEVKNPFGKRILGYGLDQFRLAETQKYAHVTFFFNGGYRNPLDSKKETYFLIESDKIDSFAAAPKMKAMEIADQAVKNIEGGRFDFGLINFANTDMVGHTGDFKAAVIAAETVDMALKKVLNAVKKAGGLALVTADHGNADEMIILDDHGKEEICTKHSINLVPCILFDPGFKNQYKLRHWDEKSPLDLSMLAATNHILLGRSVPDDLNHPLFEV